VRNGRTPLRDRLIGLALMAYCALMQDICCALMDENNDDGGSLDELEMHVSSSFLPQDIYLDDTLRDVEWLVWVAMILLVSSHTTTATWSLGMLILDQQLIQRTWMARLAICQKYLWEEEFSTTIIEKLRHEMSVYELV